MTKICGYCGTDSEFTKEDVENGLQCRCGTWIEWNPEWEDERYPEGPYMTPEQLVQEMRDTSGVTPYDRGIQDPMPTPEVPLSATPDSLSDAEGQKPSTVPNMIEIEPGIWVQEKEWKTCHWPEEFAEVSRYVRVDGMYVLQSEMEAFWEQVGEED